MTARMTVIKRVEANPIANPRLSLIAVIAINLPSLIVDTALIVILKATVKIVVTAGKLFYKNKFLLFNNNKNGTL